MRKMNSRVVAVSVLTVVVMLLCLAGSASADTWSQAASGGMDGNYHPMQSDASSMTVFGSNLYVGTGNSSTGTGCEVWRSPDGTTWTQVNTDGFTSNANGEAMSAVTFGSNLPRSHGETIFRFCQMALE